MSREGGDAGSAGNPARAGGATVPRSGTVVRAVILALALLVLAAQWVFPELREKEREALALLEGKESVGPLLLLLSYALVAVLFLPCFPLDLAAGAHFGFWEGALWVQVAASLASLLGYGMGRFVVRRLLERQLRHRPLWQGLGAALQAEGWRIVLLTRLAPIFPFSFLNSVYGALAIPLRVYFPATFLGMLPGTFLSVYLGMVGADLSGAARRPEILPWQWALQAVGLAGTVLAVLLLTRRAHALLRSKLEQ